MRNEEYTLEEWELIMGELEEEHYGRKRFFERVKNGLKRLKKWYKGEWI